MKTADFLIEFDEDQFPQVAGPWIGLDFHDPPFRPSELSIMRKRGLIDFNTDGTKYRLTLKASLKRATATAPKDPT